MSNGSQLCPGDSMRDFFRAHIRRETALDDAAIDSGLSHAVTVDLHPDVVATIPVTVTPL